MIFIKKIDWIDIDRKEAEITLTDKQYELVIFSDECLGKVGDEFDDILYAMIGKDIYKSEETACLAHHLKNFEYFLIARLFDKDQNIVQLGEFLIKIGGGIPEDLQNGDLVELYARRIDIY